MKKEIYMGLFIAMLVLLALTFWFQVKTFGGGNRYQWYLLMTIIIVGISSYYLSRHMREEGWFGKQQKKGRK